MSDLLPPPPDPPTNGSNPVGPTEPHHQPSSGPAAPASSSAAPAATTSKRQRRPSVRLGDIGEQPAASDAYLRRASKHFKLPHHSSAGPTAHRNSNPNPNLIPNPNNKTRTLTHLDPAPHSPTDHDADANLETLAASVRSRNPKYPKRGRKARSGWTSTSKPEEDEDEGFRSEFDDLRRDDSLSPSGDRDRARHDLPLSENEARDWNENGNVGLDEDGGVRSWLNRLGLGRYAPVFEIHEVDDEVLPLLTLEDLKDMGINAVGSRRKMYCAIQKLKKSFT